jgi:hypothetical protein
MDHTDLLAASPYHVPAAKTVGLMWSDTAGDQTVFEIERSTMSDFSQGVVTFYVPTPNVFEFFDAPGLSGPYFYEVCAINSGGSSTPWIYLGSATIS